MRSILIGLVLIVACSCAGKKKSARETRRDEIRTQAELKRHELLEVAGQFFGRFVTADGDESTATLLLEVKDLPRQVDGEVDPIIVPVLTGSVLFHLGSEASAGETDIVSFGLTSSDYDTQGQTATLVGENSVYEQILLDLDKLASGDLHGSWNLPSASLTGGVTFARSSQAGGGASLVDYLGPGLEGRYTGYADWGEQKRSQLAELNITTADAPPDAVAVSGALRLYFGDKPGSEYLSISLPVLNLQPVSGRFSAKSESAAISVTGKVTAGCITGDWTSKQSGKMGRLHLCQSEDIKPKHAVKEVLSGTYQGPLTNTNPTISLPERIQIGLVAGGIEEQSEGLRWAGDIRFYLGDFGSIEYFQLPMSEIKYDPFTQAFSAKVEDDYNFSLVGLLRYGSFAGILIQDGSGQIATIVADRKRAPEASDE